MEEQRPSPQQLLYNIQKQQEAEKTGKLKIFFGYAYVERHARPDTLALLDGLEQLPCREIEYKGVLLKEFDLDSALQRKPQLILVDELAHSNAQGCRHAKRYQDV